MTVTEKKVVSLIYELRHKDEKGEIIENLKPESPLTFIYGSGQLLPKFEENIKDFNKGDKFKFQLKPDEAYGEFNKDAIVNLPLNIFEVEGVINYEMLKVGNNIPMQDNNGNRLTGIVKEIKEDIVEMDFNHPLVGKSLHFMGEVIDIRDANAEELEHGHIHNEHSCKSDDEGCGNCSC